ncbi:hypothetical protein M231_03592 [Tremella mesenterica]|uniref:Uncharacterized protein n=1 Tax=Tremella mesenterica TaxID=5217 RepID=A0A4V1M445_TREME|nr:hypothetical protein M231_03592 [Tremella mesenterica]
MPMGHSFSPDTHQPVPRDRRAYSFPVQSTPTIPVPRKRDHRQSMVMPRFARKSNAVALSTATTPVLTCIREQSSSSRGFGKLAQRKNVNLPPALDSVFCSTSESSDNEQTPNIGSPLSLSLPAPLTGGHNSTLLSSDNVLKPEIQVQSSVSTRISPTHLSSHKISYSPVAALLASSASSRSREDIISWAKAVNLRPDDLSTSEDEHPTARPRGRSRTRRGMPSYVPPDTSDDVETPGLGTTPKGRIGSALAGLSSISGFSVAPLVKALTSVTGTSIVGNATMVPATGPSTLSFLHSVPAPAAVSRVAALGTPSSSEIPAMPAYFIGGATPTLSTVSFSEIDDPSVSTDPIEQLDTITDDQSAYSSGFSRRFSASSKAKPSTFTTKTSQKPLISIRPQGYRPLSLLNTIAYLRSITPFSIGAVSPSQPQIPSRDSSESITPPVTAQANPSPPPPIPVSLNPNALDVINPTQPIVRSLPMNIVLPPGGQSQQDIEERKREREVREWLARSGRRPRSPREDLKDIPSTSSSPRPRERQNSGGHERYESYDGDASDEGEQPRGRSRKGKSVEEGDESGGRGRDRTVKAR